MTRQEAAAWRVWRETDKSLCYNPDTGQREMMTLKEYQDNNYEKKSRALDVIRELKRRIAEYQSWPGGYMKGKIRLLKDDLIAWEDFQKKLKAAEPGDWVWFDPNLPRHIYFE